MAWFACVPGGGTPVEGGHLVRLADRELPLEEVAQERVVAVRPAVFVHQQGRACELPQDIGRPVLIRHDIAQRRGQLVEDRRAGQERDLGRGAALEHLGSQVVVDEVVGAGVDPIGSLREASAAPSIASASRAGHPSVSRCQARRSIGRQPQPEFASQPDGLTLVHRQLGGTDLEQRTLGTPAGEREAHPCASRDGHLRPFGQVLDQLRKDVEARP